MKSLAGLILILTGIAIILLPFFPVNESLVRSAAQPTQWDIVLEIVRKVPANELVGIILVYLGLKAMDVKLPI